MSQFDSMFDNGTSNNIFGNDSSSVFEDTDSNISFEENNNEENNSLEDIPVIQTIEEPITDSMLTPTTKEEEPSDPNLIMRMSSEQFEQFKMILVKLMKCKAPESFVIDDNIIIHNVNGTVITTNMNKLFNPKKLNLHIINPAKYSLIFKSFKEGDVDIINDPDNQRFIIKNSNMEVYLPKRMDAMGIKDSIPDVNNVTPVCKISVTKEEQTLIKDIFRSAEHIDFLIHENKIKGVYNEDIGVYKFNDYVNEKINESNADLILRTSMFIPIESADIYHIYIGKRPDYSYICLTDCVLNGVIDIRVYEMLQVAASTTLLL